jgi:hypothetical protein
MAAVCFTPLTAVQAMVHESYAISSAHFIDVESCAAGQGFIHVSVVHAFCQTVYNAIKSMPDTLIVICPHDDTASSLRNTVLLYGAYLILCTDETVSGVVDRLRDGISAPAGIDRRLELDDASIMDAWAALDRARALNWLAAPDCTDAPALDMDMAAHYTLPANGGLRILVPDRLLFFPSPVPLPAGQDWTDANAAGEEPGRRFSAGFLAELLVDLGVSAVVCLGRTSGGDAAAFRACGVDVHDLGLDAGRPALLRGMDRLLALARAVPGAVAVCGWGGDEAGVGRECVGTLGAAWLMTEAGFDAGSAEAWVGMM